MFFVIRKPPLQRLSAGATTDFGFFRRKVAEKHADHSRATADNLCMRTESFDKTFLKSFCAGFQRALAQASFGRECEGRQPSRCANLGYEVNRDSVANCPANRECEGGTPHKPRGYTCIRGNKPVPKGGAFGTPPPTVP